MTNLSGRILSRDQMKQIKGGNPPVGGGGTSCAGDGVVCHEENGLQYVCSTEPIGSNGETRCCCGHSDYNWVCAQ